MDPVGTFLALIVLAFIVYALIIKPRRFAMTIKKRLAEGKTISDRVDCHTVAELLTNAKIEKLKEVRMCYVEGEQGEKTDCVDIVCKGGVTYRVSIRPRDIGNSTLSVNVKSSARFGIEGAFDSIRHYQEAEYIERYIVSQINPSYVEASEDDSKRLKSINVTKYCAVGIIIAVCAYAIIPEIAARIRTETLDHMVSNSTLSAYSTSTTLGEAFETFDPNGKWSTEDSKKSLKKNGIAYVEWNGSCAVITNTKTYELPINVSFCLSLVNNTDDVYMSVDHIAINQSACYYSSDLSDVVVVTDLMKVLYGIQSEAILYVQLTSDVNSAQFVTVSGIGGNGGTGLLNENHGSNLEIDDIQPDYTEPAATVGQYDGIAGTWQDEDGNGYYLFIGYADATMQTAYAYVITANAEFEVNLKSGNGETASGTVMGYGSEPVYALDVSRNKYWLETLIYYGELSYEEHIKFLPADPETCPYNNPYYIPHN